jgi:hypothetical protein
VQDLRQLVRQAHRRVNQAADAAQVQTYWEMGSISSSLNKRGLTGQSTASGSC